MATAKKAAPAKKAAAKKAPAPAAQTRPGIDVAEHAAGDNPTQLKRTSTGSRPRPLTGADNDDRSVGKLGIGDDRAVTTTLEEANEAGLLGVEVDGTPNKNYTVAGQAAGLPTPENAAGITGSK